MNFKRYHVSRNLFDVSTVEKGRIDNGDVGYTPQTTSLSIVGETVYFTTNAAYRGVCSDFFEIPETGNITFNFTRNLPLGVKFVFYDSNKTWLNADVTPQLIDIPPATASIPIGAKYVRLSFTGQITGGSDYVMSNIMLNVGSTPLPYEPYSSEVWHDIPHYVHKTDTDTITTLPADIYANDTTATVGLKGNMVQSGTPTPTTLIQPQECGDLETEGAKAGQYKIPILSGGVTTPVYLGEVQSTRRIKKLVLTGEENWNKSITRIGNFYLGLRDSEIQGGALCDRAVNVSDIKDFSSSGKVFMQADGLNKWLNLWLFDTDISIADFKSYLAAQYAAGTPVCVWYVLATETTGIVNEPLRKIGNYADTVSGITIPTITGKDSFDVLTTLKPSEVELTYTGWHDATVEEWDGSEWQ